jgi:glycosyltransferase involved in cell wall biosynthesis
VKTFSYALPLLKRSLLHAESLAFSRFEISQRCQLSVKEREKMDTCVVAMYEDPLLLSAARRISGYEGLKSVAFLLLPPFYGDKARMRNIELSHILYLREIHRRKTSFRAYEILARKFRNLWRPHLEKLLKNFDLLVAVSRSIPLEMGVEWSNIKILDPSLNLDKEDLELIERVLREYGSKYPKHRDNLVLFSTRPDAEKGIIEALYAFSFMSKKRPELRLAITGKMSKSAREGILKLAKKLGILDKVILTGYISREELFKIRARSRLLLYPSHVDSFSFTILEALYLGLPIIGYDIPGNRYSFLEKGAKGISLVKEFDVVSMAEEGLRMIDDNVDVSPPNLPSWDEIVSKEIELLRRVVG